MANNNAILFQNILKQYRSLMRKAPDMVGIIAVELFKESFQRKGMIMGMGVQSWKPRGNGPRSRQGAALLKKSGQLQRSIQYTKSGRRVTVFTDEAYAQIQNDGGTIHVTQKMRRFFYAMYKQSGDEFWKNMIKARQITIPARPFIYDTPELVTRLDKKFVPMLDKIVNP